jgi:hypothetical protein
LKQVQQTTSPNSFAAPQPRQTVSVRAASSEMFRVVMIDCES